MQTPSASQISSTSQISSASQSATSYAPTQGISSRECVGGNCSTKRRPRNGSCSYQLCKPCCLRHLQNNLSATCGAHKMPATKIHPSTSQYGTHSATPPPLELQGRSPTSPPHADTQEFHGVPMPRQFRTARQRLVEDRLRELNMKNEKVHLMRRTICVFYWEVRLHCCFIYSLICVLKAPLPSPTGK